MKLYLTRRNLQTLINKLDRKAAGGETACTIIKNRNDADPLRQSMPQIYVIAVEDEEFYVNRGPGPMHPLDEPKPH
jgi:hypothetical protein